MRDMVAGLVELHEPLYVDEVSPPFVQVERAVDVPSHAEQGGSRAMNIGNARRRSRRSLGAVLVAVAGVVVGACDAPRDATPAHADVMVEDSAGVTIVRNVVADPASLAVEEVRRIGVVEGAEPYLFSGVHSVAVSPEDTLFVGDSQSGTVRVFDPAGRFVRRLGGLGDGPGEVRGIAAVWLTGDTVVVREAGGSAKTVLMRASGDFIRSWRGRLVDGTRIETVAHGPTGWIVEHWRTPWEGEPGDSVGDVVELRSYDPTSGRLGDVVFERPRRGVYVTGDGTVDEALFRVFGNGFDDSGRFYRTHQPAYEIGLYATDGSLARLVRRSHEPGALGPEDVDEYRRIAQAVLDTLTDFGPPGTIDDQVMAEIDRAEGLPLPESWSPIRHLLVSADGWVWAENVEKVSPGALELVNPLGPAADDRLGPSTWDLFDREGVFLGQVSLPSEFVAMAVRGLEVTGVSKDDLGVEYVVTYRAGV